MTLRTFADVAALGDDDVHRVVTTGAPIERVWGAWALGQRASAERVEAATFAEPTPGVRRHFIVVLAGMGRHAALEALACHDPHPAVRATALLYLVRLAPAVPALWSVIAARLAAEPDVDARRTILDHLPADAPLLDDVVGRLADPTLEIRRAAIAWLAPVAPDVVHRRTLTEPDLALRRELLVRWLAADGAGPVLHALADARAVALALEVLELVAYQAVAWIDVAPLAALGGDDVRDAIMGAFYERWEELPAAWFLPAAVAHGVVDGGYTYAVLDAVCDLGAVSPALRDCLRTAIAEVDAEVRRVRSGGYVDDDMVDPAAYIAHLERLLAELCRITA